MQRVRVRSMVVGTIVATLAVGLASTGVAHADGTLTVTPSTGLVHGQSVTIGVSGYTPNALATAQFAICGNAYADNTPLAAMPTVTPGILNTRDCEVMAFTSPGDFAGATYSLPGVELPQTGIGTGNRSCVAAGIAPCFVYVSTSVNLPTLPQVSVTFAEDPEAGVPAATTSTVSGIGTPIADGKTAHAHVTVVATGEPALRPEGDVAVYEGPTLLGTGTLAADATANVTLGVLSLGLHTLTAEYLGNGSFASSSAPSSAMSVISASNVSIGDASIVEGDSTGTRIVTLPVVLSKPSPVPLQMNYSIVAEGANPAAPGTDYVVATGVLKFLALKQTVRYVNVKVRGDTTPEPNENFTVHLSNVTAGYEFRDADGSGLILDDDSPSVSTPTVSIGDAAVPEGDVGGARSMKFTLTLSSAVTTTDVIVSLQISNGTATRGTKLSGGDWSGAINKNVRIRANLLSKQLVVPAFADTNDELDETVSVRIMGVTGAAKGGRFTATGTILTDE